MTMKHRAAALLFTVFAGLGAAPHAIAQNGAQDGAQNGPQVSTFTLENGLRGYVIEDHRAPVVTHMMWYQVGAADEPPGYSGVAHFLEHLMFKGTEKIGAGRFSEIIAENGGQDNAFTSRDYTAYHQRIARDRLGLAMEMEADRMTGLIIDENFVDQERDVVLEERSSRVDNDPSSRFREQFSAALYLNHPYGSPVIGWRNEIEALSRENALEFYRRFYTPENALLIVAGDVTPDEVEALARETYGKVESTGAPPRAERPKEPPHLAARRVIMEDERVRQDYMTRAWLVPSYTDPDVATSAALNVLAEILGGGQTSRLSRTLSVEEGLALYAGAYYMGNTVDPSEFGLYAVPAEGVSLETLEARLDEILADFILNGPDETELKRAKTVIAADAIYQQDSQEGMARYFGAGLTIGLDLERLKSWPDPIEEVSAEDVRAAAERYLRPQSSVTGWLKRAQTASESAGGIERAVQKGSEE